MKSKVIIVSTAAIFATTVALGNTSTNLQPNKTSPDVVQNHLNPSALSDAACGGCGGTCGGCGGTCGGCGGCGGTCGGCGGK